MGVFASSNGIKCAVHPCNLDQSSTLHSGKNMYQMTQPLCVMILQQSLFCFSVELHAAAASVQMF